MILFKDTLLYPFWAADRANSIALGLSLLRVPLSIINLY